MRLQSNEHCTDMTFIGGLLERSLCSLKRTKLPVSTLPESIWTNQRPFGTPFFGKISEKKKLFGHNQSRHVWRKANTEFQEKNLLPTLRNGGGNFNVWGSFSASGPWRLHIIQGNLNSLTYQQICEDNLLPSVRELKMAQKWVMQQHNDPKHSKKSTKEWLKRNKVHTLDWPSQSPDINSVEMLWLDLKHAIHARCPSNLSQLSQSFARRSGQKSPKTDVRNWSVVTEDV
uniref:Tc1-like transposase DDE domain-containing protein n=1 Tax=Cyprinus carpio carpio TaxID=630221 RepID=A0A9J8DJ06_CYPCA